MGDWRYYNNAMISTLAPHITPDTSCMDEHFFTVGGKRALFARWTTDFDKQDKSEWWYVIKDTPFDISTLKSSRRYEINKGIKNFECKRIVAADYAESIYEIIVESYNTYPEKYRPHVTCEMVAEWTKGWKHVWGAFDSEGKLSSFLQASIHDEYIDLMVLKSLPSKEKYNVNFAIINAFLNDMSEKIREGKYICNGERNLVHETQFNNFIEKYFGFRKAYCTLNVKYPKKVKLFARMIYPFRKIFYSSQNKLMFKIGSVLKMEEIARITGGQY